MSAHDINFLAYSHLNSTIIFLFTGLLMSTVHPSTHNEKKMEPLLLSVFIIAQDEEDRIQKAIESVIDWVDEVIVIDSGSTDNTIKIAQDCGATVLSNEWQGYGQQKRFGEDQCKHRWILNIDADERITEQAKNEILSILEQGPKFSGYRINFKDIMPFESSPKPRAWETTHIRLYDVTQGRFRNHSSLDSVVMDKENVGSIESVCHHQSIRSFTHLVQKANYYTGLQAEDMTTKGRIIGAKRLLTEFPLAFIKAYFLRRYYIHGLYGFSFSMIYAFSKFLRFAKRFEQQLMDTRPK